MSIIAPQPKDDYKYIDPIGLYASAVANGNVAIANDATVDELVFDGNATAAAYTLLIELQYQIPADFKAFGGLADDLTIQFIQDADSGDGVGDLGLTIVVLDSLGNVVDDSSIAAVAGTAGFVTLDCPLVTAGTWTIGDYFVVQISIAQIGACENLDGVRFTIPKLKYIPQ